jgi:glutamyl-tRNA synthetase
MRQLPVEDRAAGVIPYLVRAKLIVEPVSGELETKIRRIVEACGERLKLFSDILPYGSFFFRDPEYDPQALKKRVHKEGMPAHLRDFAAVLKQTDPFDVPTLEAKLKEFCDARQLKSGDMIHAVRVSTTGVQVGPGVYDCLAILGRDEVVRRIELALAAAAS